MTEMAFIYTLCDPRTDVQHKDIVEKKLIRVCSRPDMGIVMVVEVLKFGKLWCVRTSKGGIFDEFDIVSVTPEEEKKFKMDGSWTSHSPKDWLKRDGSSDFFCIENKKIVTIKFCRDECYPVRLGLPSTRAECKEANAVDVSSMNGHAVESVGVKEKRKEDVGIPNFMGIQELRLKHLEDESKKSIINPEGENCEKRNDL